MFQQFVQQAELKCATSIHALLSESANWRVPGRCFIALKNSKYTYWVYGKDGWFRNLNGTGKGYGLMIRHVHPIGRPIESATHYIRNIQIQYAPSSGDGSDIESTTAKLFLIKELVDNDLVTFNALIQWINIQGKSQKWMP